MGFDFLICVKDIRPADGETEIRQPINQGHAVVPYRPVILNSHAIGAALRDARKAMCRRVELVHDADDSHFVDEFPALVCAVEAGFRREELIMELLGFPRLKERLAENATILCALHRVVPAVERRDLALARQVVLAYRAPDPRPPLARPTALRRRHAV